MIHLVTENTDAMLAYWDSDLICKYANNAYFKWFGKTPEQLIDKISLKELLGADLYTINEQHVLKVLAGETQVFYRNMTLPSGDIKHVIVTYHPNIEHGLIKGFFVHVADLGIQNKNQDTPVTQKFNNSLKIDSVPDHRMTVIAEYLNEEIFNGFPGLETIARKYLVSVSKLKRDFKAAYNQTPLIFYRNLQMEYAAKYLKEKKVSKKELASLLNFSNPSNFSSYFRRFMNDVGNKRQQALIKQQSQELNKIFIEQSPFAIAMCDRDMRYLAVSQQWLIDYHLQGVEIIGRTHYEIFPEIPDEFKLIHKECLLGKIDKREEYCWKKPGGCTQWIKWDVRPWYSEGEEIGGLLMYTEDITEKKLKERSTARTEYIINKTIEIARIGIWERNLASGHVTCNQVSLDILELDERKGSTLDEIFEFFEAGESRKMIQTAINEAILSGISFDLELNMNTAKNNIKPVRVIGQVEIGCDTATTLYGLFIEI